MYELQDACFTQLRTVEGLGYVAQCFSTTQQGFGSFQVLVQSEEFGPERVLNSINSFLEGFYNSTVSADSGSDLVSNFSKAVSDLEDSLTARDLNLQSKTDRLWNQIASGLNQFDFKSQLVDMLQDLELEGFQEFYEETILQKQSRHKLVVIIYGKDKQFQPPVDFTINYRHLNGSSMTLPLQKNSP